MSELGPSPYTDPVPLSTPFSSPFGERFPPPPPPPPVSSAPQNLLYDLRPLSLGEILDRTFSLYRKRFWLFAGLSTVTAATISLLTLASLMIGLNSPKAAIGMDPAATQQLFRMLGVFGVIYVVVMILYLVAYAVTQAATVAAISAVYTGEETSIGIALRRVRKHWFRYILIMLWQAWSAVWLPFVLTIPAVIFMTLPGLRWLGGFLIFLIVLSFIYAPFAVIRNSLGVVASAVEELPVRQAMRRSKFLVSGHKARVLGIMLLLMALSIAAGVVQQIFQLPLLFVTGPAKYLFDALLLVVVFATSSMLTPVGPIALTLFYIDERVRKEGFDLEILMQRTAPPPPQNDLSNDPGELPSPFTSEIV